MSRFSMAFGRSAKMVSVISAAVFAVSSAAAGATCGLCDSEIVMDSDLANCFLQKYGDLAKLDDPAIAVDLSDCESSRGIIEALPSPNLTVDEPDTQFMISRSQLECLKKKLEQPDIEFNPTAKINLDSCI